jgi:hypothetical protein
MKNHVMITNLLLPRNTACVPNGCIRKGRCHGALFVSAHLFYFKKIRPPNRNLFFAPAGGSTAQQAHLQPLTGTGLFPLLPCIPLCNNNS